MKSRRDILEELDIKCGQWSCVALRLDDHRIKTFAEMVKGRSLCFIIAVASMSIIKLPRTCCGLDGQLKRIVFNNNGLGTYSFEYETNDGTFRREEGGVVDGPGGGSLVVRGEYGYVDRLGRRFGLRYIADANGFQPLIYDDSRFNDRRIV